MPDCGAPATDASVWYELRRDRRCRPAGGRHLRRRICAGVIVVTGDPGSFDLVTCGPDSVAFDAFAGETYHILAFDYQGDGGGNGGTLEISVDVAPPPPEIALTVDPVGHFTKSGSATVSGTVTCTGTNVDFAFIDLQLQQRVGRVLINGFGSIDFACDGDTHAWSVEVFAENGLFQRRPRGDHHLRIGLQPDLLWRSLRGGDRQAAEVTALSASGLTMAAWMGWRLDVAAPSPGQRLLEDVRRLVQAEAFPQVEPMRPLTSDPRRHHQALGSRAPRPRRRPQRPGPCRRPRRAPARRR